MGLFSKRQAEELQKCKLCDKPLLSAEEQTIELCTAHALIMDTDVKVASEAVAEYQVLANSETDPDRKILYFKLMLNALYTIKVKYYENGVEPLDQDIDDLIDSVVDLISKVRL